MFVLGRRGWYGGRFESEESSVAEVSGMVDGQELEAEDLGWEESNSSSHLILVVSVLDLRGRMTRV
jgi:hypothetical protein